MIDARGRVSPCFFIGGPAPAAAADDLEEVLNSEAMTGLRGTIRRGERAECARCVCSMWRDPGAAAADRGLLPAGRGA